MTDGEDALHLVFKLVCRLAMNWWSINAPNQLTLLLSGHRHVDGKLQVTQSEAAKDAAA